MDEDEYEEADPGAGHGIYGSGYGRPVQPDPLRGWRYLFGITAALLFIAIVVVGWAYAMGGC